MQKKTLAVSVGMAMFGAGWFVGEYAGAARAAYAQAAITQVAAVFLAALGVWVILDKRVGSVWRVFACAGYCCVFCVGFGCAMAAIQWGLMR